MFTDYGNLPPNHAPTYSDVLVNPFSAAAGLGMDQYSSAEDRARYPSHMAYPMSPEMGELDEATNLHGLYPSGGGGGGTGWGDDPTGTGGGTGPSGYGYGAPYGGGAGAYDYHPAHAPVHVPTGGSYSHHATAGSGYGGYAPPPPKTYARPHPTVPTKGFKKKHSSSDSNASTMNALTLLAFFFFVNLLQSCLKENMEAMNPTVMVMTTNMVRNRNTKLAEMNSREQSSSPASAFTSGANIVVAPETLVSAGSSSVAAGAPGLASVTLQTSPYSDGGGAGGAAAGVSSAVNVGNNYASGAGVTSNNNHISNYNNNNHGGSDNGNRQPGEPQYSYGTNGVNSGQQHHGGAAMMQNQHNQNANSNNNNQAYGASHHGDTYPFSPAPTIITANRDPRPELYDPPYLYRNQTINSATSLNQQHYYQQQLQQHHQHHQQQRPYPPEQFEEEEYEAQAPQQQPPSQIQQHQQHEHLVHNQFQQQQQQQHYHGNRPNDNYAQQQQTDHLEDYPEHHHNQQPVPHPPRDHFQHHYSAQHPQQQSSFHSQQHQNYGTNRRPSPPNRGYSEASHPWSYSPASSTFRRGSSNSPLSSYTWSSDSSKGHVSGNNNFGDHDDDDDRRYEDSFYTRSERKL